MSTIVLVTGVSTLTVPVPLFTLPPAFVTRTQKLVVAVKFPVE
jgi:hypothetical protein